MSTEMENGFQMTFEEYMPEIFQEQSVGASDSPVRTSQLRESSLDLLETAQVCFSELCTWLDNSKKKRNPLTCSLRTLKICLVLMEDGISPNFSLKWTKLGMMQNGRFSIPSISECRIAENESSLLDILEENTDEKYFLSQKTIKRLLSFKETSFRPLSRQDTKVSGGGYTSRNAVIVTGGHKK